MNFADRMKVKKSEITREESLAKVKEVIKENIKYYDCGLFFTRNIMGDSMATLYEDDYFCVDGCYFWSYYEVFGMTTNEQKMLNDYYMKLLGEIEDD